MEKFFKSQFDLLAIYGQKIHYGDLPGSVAKLRCSLIWEEAQELCEAIERMQSQALNPFARENMLKEFADLLVVAFGSMAQAGFSYEELSSAMQIVHENNMSKCYKDHMDADFARAMFQRKDGNPDGSDYKVEEIEMGSRKVYVVKRADNNKVCKRYPFDKESCEEKITKKINNK